MLRRWRRSSATSAGIGRASAAGVGEAAIAVEQAIGRDRLRARPVLGRLGPCGAREGDDPAQHLDEGAGERQVRPARIGGDVEEDQPALAGRGGGDERRAVGERRPGALGEVAVGLGQHLALDQRRRRERPCRRRGSPRRRCASGCGVSQVRLPPRTRSPWRSRTGTSASVAAARRGPAKRTSVPPSRDPVRHRFLDVGRQRADVGHGDDRGAALDQLGHGDGGIGVARLARRRRRAGRRGRCNRAAREAAAPCRRRRRRGGRSARRRQRSSRSCTAPAVSAPTMSSADDLVPELDRQRRTRASASALRRRRRRRAPRR